MFLLRHQVSMDSMLLSELLFIAVAFYRIIAYHLTDHHHLGFESSILYWHFVDVVWLFLYISFIGGVQKVYSNTHTF